MKKSLLFVFAAAALSLFAGCAKSSAKIRIGATEVPHAELLNLVKDDLAAEGVNLEVVVMNDYVTLNDAVENGDLFANFDQHTPYMNATNAEKGYHLINVGGIHIEPFAVYSEKYKSLNDLPDGATFAIPNDPTNEGRALLLLQSAGLITLKDPTNLSATPVDIESNPKNFKFAEIDAASLARVLGDVDAATINGNYALAAGLSASKDGLFVENKDSPYVNIVVTRDGRQKDERLIRVVRALQTKKVKDYIQEHFPNGEVVTVF